MKVAIEDEFCTGCGNCTISCPGNFPIHWPEIEFGRKLEIKNGRVILAGELCNGCGVCVESCPFDAIKIIPNEQKEVEKTETIYEVSKRKYVSKETKLDVNPRLNDMFQSIRKTFSTAPLRSMFEYSDVKIEKIVNFVNDFEKKYKYKTSIHERDPNERIKDFLEAIEGYTLKDAIKEAERCQNCAGPRCMEGCPLKVDIPYFIEKIKENDIQKAAEIIKRKNPFPAITGRVCPQELQCESRCAYNFSDCEPVAIGKLERFVGDWALKLQLQTRNTASKVDHMGEREGIKEIGITKYKKKIAVVGSGPSGLACAVELAKKGYEVTIFETLHKPGGVLIYGIPEFRLPKETVEEEIEYVKSFGVKIITGVLVGNTLTVDDLLEEYDVVFLGTGAGLPRLLGIDGEKLPGIYSANEYLIRINLMKAYRFPEYGTPIKRGKKVAVIGGGNVAMDAARCALRLGAENVYIIYRRSEEEMSARLEEIRGAKDEGVKFMTLTNPLRFIGNEMVEKIELERMRLGEPDSSGRKRPIPIKGSNFMLDVDTVVIAIGQKPHPIIMKTTSGLDVDRRKGTLIVNHDGKTNIENLYAGGDVTTGAATVVSAMSAGMRSAKAIDSRIKYDKNRASMK